MSEVLETCIYCSESFDPSKGDGDHTVVAAFGEFAGFDNFRGCCHGCNQRFKESEEELIRCTPQGFLARMSDPPRRRPRNSIEWPDAKTAKAPKFFQAQNGTPLIVRSVTRDPRNMAFVNQIVLLTDHGDRIQIKVFPGMKASDIRERIDALDVKGKYVVQFNIDEEHLDWLKAVMMELWPGAKMDDLPSIEPGVQWVKGSAEFEWTVHTWRALAKSAFHYYLQTNDSGLRGDEREFAAIRQFIMEGGDPRPFFRSSGSLPQVLPEQFEVGRGVHWMHYLAADDWRPYIRVFLCLFFGPGCDDFAMPLNIILGARPDSMAKPGSWGHGLVWLPGQPGKSVLLFKEFSTLADAEQMAAATPEGRAVVVYPATER